MPEQIRADQLCLFESPTEVNANPWSGNRPSLANLSDSSSSHSASGRSEGKRSKKSDLTIADRFDGQRQAPEALQISLEPLLSKRVEAPLGESSEHTRIFHLEQALDEALRYVDELNTRVKHQAILEEQFTLTEEYAYVQHQAIDRLQTDLAEQKEAITQRNITIAALESDRSLAQTNLLSLQQNQLNLRQENAQWKNACQELQQECDRQHRKMVALEQEHTAMQEQILQQVRQSNEHETAVQYWKDRYAALQQELGSVQKMLEEKVNNSHPEVAHADMADLLNYIQSIAPQDKEGEDNDVNALSSSTLHSFNIPDFLIRRYRHRGTPNISNNPQP